MSLWSVLVMISVSAACLLGGRMLIHYFQLESYQHPGYFRTLRRNAARSVLPGILLAAIWVAFSVLFSLTPADDEWLRAACTSIAVLAGGWTAGRVFRPKSVKKPLKFTPRIKRLYTVSFLVFTGIQILMNMFIYRGALVTNGTSYVLYMFPLLLPVWIAFGGLIAWPVEKAISELYFRDAQRILRSRKDLIRIGITGSWGKTSVKFILGTILEEQYHTYVTPSSFTTPMGVTRVIRSSLEPGHRVFVAEMGARHVGDIREMCRLVHPHYGILTSVGPQHLDTFRTIERITKTKYELMEAIPRDGICFFADDNGICRNLYRKTDKPKYLSGTDPEADDVWAEEISVGPEGSRFFLCTGKERIPCETVLLGELNIRNIILCASVALALGLTGEQIARGIRKIQPVEHRLQMIPNPGGITLIDDAFNSNISGAAQAFHVLASFPGKRIVITPGMVELGRMEEEMNRQFGEIMAESCDAAILVGKKRSEAIAEGLRAKSFPEKSIHIVNSLEEAAAYMRTIVKPGDTVLFENDLPDNYTE